MEYQGFTGSNFEEDDRERAKRGGSIGGFGRNTLPPGYAEAMTDAERMRSGMPSRSVAAERISPETKAALDQGIEHSDEDEKYGQIADIQKRLENRQVILDAITQNAAKSDPRFAEDFREGTRKYYEDFRQKYPEFEKLEEEQDRDLNDVAFNPLNSEYAERQDQKALDDALKQINQGRDPERFLKIGDIIKPKWTK